MLSLGMERWPGLALLTLVASCAQFRSVPVEKGAGNKCETRALIDDSEDADDQLATKEGRKGYWYTFKDESGTAILRRYFDHYVAIAREQRTGLLLETPTWRANPDWAAKLLAANPHLNTPGVIIP